MQPQPQQRFTLDTSVAVAWLHTLANLGNQDLPSEYDSPTGLDLRISHDWERFPRTEENSESEAWQIVTAAQELGILASPDNCEIIPVEGGAYWNLICDQYAGLVLTSAQDATLRTVNSYARGPEAALELLQEAVQVGNTLLQRLESAAPLVMAKTTEDPVLLTRLTDSTDPTVRSYAAQNPLCPDEGQVLAALKKNQRF